MMRQLTTSAVMAGFLFALSGGVARAESTEREKQLEETVQLLLQRVETLESKLEALSQSAPAETRVEERLEKIEQSVAAQSARDNAFDVYWKKGLQFETSDKNFKLHIGGRVHNDYYWGGYDEGDFDNGVRFRRARLQLDGQLYTDYKFKWEYDFAEDGTAKWKDVYLAYTGLDLAKVQIGHFKEPFGLEELTGTNSMTLIENSPVTSAFVPSYQTGLMLFNSLLNRRLTWQAGAFYTGDNAFGDAENESSGKEANGEWDFAARVTGLPWYDNEGERLLHLGLAYHHREYDDSNARYRARGSWSRGDRLADTGAIAAESGDTIGAEAALLLGPASLQGEYLYLDLDRSTGGSEEFQGGYILASYVLTGEHRTYKDGGLAGVEPARNFSLKKGGAGAWELTARYSWLDLDDRTKGGEMDDIVMGLNWYLNSSIRMMANYAHGEEDGDGAGDEADVFTLRLQLAF